MRAAEVQRLRLPEQANSNRKVFYSEAENKRSISQMELQAGLSNNRRVIYQLRIVSAVLFLLSVLAGGSDFTSERKA